MDIQSVDEIAGTSRGSGSLESAEHSALSTSSRDSLDGERSRIVNPVVAEFCGLPVINVKKLLTRETLFTRNAFIGNME